MRNVKFRGKDVATGEWRYGFVYIGIPETYISYIIPEHIYNGYPSKDGLLFDEAWEVIHESVGQYTGLKDKNGKEIYEGDIMKVSLRTEGRGDRTKWKDFNMAIEWVYHSAQFHVKYPPDYGQYRFMNGGMEFYEIVGNVFDNPELLKMK